MVAAVIGDYAQRSLGLGDGPLTVMSADLNDQGSSSNGSSASITANDFLTLLVTEMKNQDPTANTDPNEYVNQLVQVNSLQQLISINETLSTALTGNTRPAVSTRNQVDSPLTTAENASLLPNSPVALNRTDGNLSLPAGTRAALQIASSLSKR